MSHSRLLGLIVALVLATIVMPAPVAVGEPSQVSLHQAGLVVQFSGGNFLTRCIEFQEDEISGTEMLRRSDLRVILESAGGMGAAGTGAAICKIEGDGCDYPDEPCFCQCRGGGQCFYWAYYLWNGDGWRGSGTGSGNRKLGDGDIDGWVWGSTGPPPIVSWDDIHDQARTSVGYPRVEAAGDSLTITAPFQGDENGNGTASLRVRPMAGIWDEPTEMDRETNNYIAQVSQLPDGRYEMEVTYNDPDGLNGTASWIQEAVVGTPMTYMLFVPIHFAPLDLELRGNAR